MQCNAAQNQSITHANATVRTSTLGPGCLAAVHQGKKLKARHVAFAEPPNNQIKPKKSTLDTRGEYSSIILY